MDYPVHGVLEARILDCIAFPFYSRSSQPRNLTGESRDTWSKTKIRPWSTKWSRSKANRILPREHTGHSKTLFQQHKRRFYTLTSSDGQYQNQNDYLLCSQRWRSSVQSAKTRPGADCGSDHELLITNFRLKLKKGGEELRWWRNRMGRPLSPLQIHRKNNWVQSKVHRTTSGH